MQQSCQRIELQIGYVTTTLIMFLCYSLDPIYQIIHQPKLSFITNSY